MPSRLFLGIENRAGSCISAQFRILTSHIMTYMKEAKDNLANLARKSSFRNVMFRYLMIIGVAAAVFHKYEGWSPEDALYSGSQHLCVII